MGAFGLLLLFAYAFSWVMAVVGLLVRTPEVVNNASFMVIFPLTFIANTFVPSAEPARRAAGGRRVEPGLGASPRRPASCSATWAAAPRPIGLGAAEPALYVLIWVVVILVVFVPLAVRQYERRPPGPLSRSFRPPNGLAPMHLHRDGAAVRGA